MEHSPGPTSLSIALTTPLLSDPVRRYLHLRNWAVSTLSADGASVYYVTGAGSPEEFPTIHRLPIDDPQSPEEVYRSVEAGSFFSALSVSEDGTKLVADEDTQPPVPVIAPASQGIAHSIALQR